MIYLKWVDGGWRYADGFITARFGDGTVVVFPVGKARLGAFFISRVGEHEWRIAPVRNSKLKRESFDSLGRFYDFIHISGGPDATHQELDKI